MPTAPAPPEAAATPLHVAVRTLDAAALAAAGHTAASAVAAVYAHAVMRGAASFWLDSALPDPAEARWSVAGDGLDVLGEEQGRVPSPARAWSGTTTPPIRTARGRTSRPRPHPGRWSAARACPCAAAWSAGSATNSAWRIWG
ncbi:hypothetical protein [Micrococcus luteus]|uniref:hypothetical protein n=1 Tax=Micrococcus luteus TaxID=1270 RepID=UPI0020CED84C|nr:hypothetical protein [Micrococcus luteus]UTT46183.1 hypothetical protein NMQ02_02830 [Micrococcus luteus]